MLTLSGELDAYDAPALRAAFADAAADGSASAVVLDLTAVSFLDSTALGTIVGLLRRVRERGGELRVVLPETEARRIFELTSLDRSLDVWPSRASALARLTLRRTGACAAEPWCRRRGWRPVDRELVDDRPDDREAHARSRPALRRRGCRPAVWSSDSPWPSSSTVISIASDVTSKTNPHDADPSPYAWRTALPHTSVTASLRSASADLAHRHLARDAGQREPHEDQVLRLGGDREPHRARAHVGSSVDRLEAAPHRHERAAQQARDVHLRDADSRRDLRLRQALEEPQLDDRPLARVERVEAGLDEHTVLDLLVPGLDLAEHVLHRLLVAATGAERLRERAGRVRVVRLERLDDLVLADARSSRPALRSSARVRGRRWWSRWCASG